MVRAGGGAAPCIPVSQGLHIHTWPRSVPLCPGSQGPSVALSLGPRHGPHQRGRHIHGRHRHRAGRGPGGWSPWRRPPGCPCSSAAASAPGCPAGGAGAGGGGGRPHRGVSGFSVARTPLAMAEPEIRGKPEFEKTSCAYLSHIRKCLTIPGHRVWVSRQRRNKTMHRCFSGGGKWM